MISYLTVEQALRIARFAFGGRYTSGIGSGRRRAPTAGGRPRAGRLSDLLTEGAALLHSVAVTPLVDGNKRLAWLATYVFLAKNGVELDPDDDAAYDLVIAVASGEIDDVAGDRHRLARVRD